VYRYTHYGRTADPDSPSIRMAVAGTGGQYLGSIGATLQRRLFSLVKAHDHGKVSDDVVANELAKLNYQAYRQVGDGSVGPRCIIIWRHRRDGRRRGGGAHQCYTELDREPSTPVIPIIGSGMDMAALAEVTMKQFESHLATHGFGGFGANTPPWADRDEINRLLAQYPWGPDEKLR
jgi:hypothetical protein